VVGFVIFILFHSVGISFQSNNRCKTAGLSRSAKRKKKVRVAFGADPGDLNMMRHYPRRCQLIVAHGPEIKTMPAVPIPPQGFWNFLAIMDEFRAAWPKRWRYARDSFFRVATEIVFHDMHAAADDIADAAAPPGMYGGNNASVRGIEQYCLAIGCLDRDAEAGQAGYQSVAGWRRIVNRPLCCEMIPVNDNNVGLVDLPEKNRHVAADGFGYGLPILAHAYRIIAHQRIHVQPRKLPPAESAPAGKNAVPDVGESIQR
jgi:hypothetical protein